MNKLDKTGRDVMAGCAVGLLIGFAILVSSFLTGCTRLQPSDRYVPGENFGASGAERCGTINTPRQWLKPCQ